MPRPLPARWQPESVREFRAAARQRFADGLALAAAGRRAGAIYLWGYAAEMTLKAAYFSFMGVADDAALTLQGHILPAIERGRTAFGIAWPKAGAGHNVRAWASLLVSARAVAPGTAFPAPFAGDIRAYAGVVGGLWSETLRYHKNVAYSSEMRRVRTAVAWLLTNSPRL